MLHISYINFWKANPKWWACKYEELLCTVEQPQGVLQGGMWGGYKFLVSYFAPTKSKCATVLVVSSSHQIHILGPDEATYITYTT